METFFVNNWRPISLLCVDYKLILKVISNGIKTTLTDIIHESQNGFILGCSIVINIQKANDIVAHINRKKIVTVIIFVDFMKAFDRIEYNPLLQAFKYFNFGPRILAWIKMLFSDIELCTTNARHNSDWWSPSLGIFQEDHLGPFAFNVMTEILSINIRNNSHIQEIKIWQIIHLLSQFADDYPSTPSNRNAWMHWYQH